MRAKVVLMAADGLHNDEIAGRLDTPREIVSKWRKRFYHEAQHARITFCARLEDLGRPPQTNPCRVGIIVTCSRHRRCDWLAPDFS
jgi:hypothetical protein